MVSRGGEKLHLGVAMYGARWSTITRTLFPGRTVNAVRNRFNRQLRKPGSSAGALASAVAGAPAGAQSGTSSGQAGPTENKLPVALALPMPGKNDSDQLPPAPYPPGYPPANGYPLLPLAGLAIRRRRQGTPVTLRGPIIPCQGTPVTLHHLAILATLAIRGTLAIRATPVIRSGAAILRCLCQTA